ncbi:glycosyl transferase [Micromonospora sonneratiae]|uniref:4-amino-4-deoxy-L-arabinose transferase n=1 Tax=Micromonospora sonneratiae TaxID=1184706 RepID=A0ABW3YFS7_9ACTN
MTSAADTAQEAGPEKAATKGSPDVTRPGRRQWLERLRRYWPDLGICLLFLVLAGWLTHGLWPDPTTRTLALNPEDQTLIEWFLANDARMLLGDFGLVSDRLNAPDGFNLMANATIIVPGLILAPITLLFGTGTSFAVLVAGNLAFTSIGWYLLYQRTLGAGRFPAAIGALFCGFAPGMISQSNSHPHMTAQWLVPAIVWCVVRMVQVSDPEHRDGAAGSSRRLAILAMTLATLVTVQVFVGEEVLFLTAITLALLTIAYAVVAPAFVRRVLPRFVGGMLLAVGLAGMALAYPLWMQFKGPQSVPNGVFSPDYFSADLASYAAISPLSIAGTPGAARLSTGASEYNTFLGLPMLLLFAACVWWLRRNRLVLAIVPVALLAAWLSLGPQVVLDGVRTDIWAPYELLRNKPVIEGALPMRFALILIPLIATVLVLALDRAMRSMDSPARLLVPIATVAVLLPIAPAPLPATSRAPVPTFISGGHWRQCVPSDGVLVPVPLPTPKEPDVMRWAAVANAEFRLPEGFFIAPYGAGGKASMGTYKQPTSTLLTEVAKTGQVPVITQQHRDQAARDVAFWGASCMVVAESERNAPALRTTLDSLFGPGTLIVDAWTWRV